MESLWKGSFIGELSKHRDFAHRSYIEHELDNGGKIDVPIEPEVLLNHDPIDYSLFSPSRKYYFVDFTLHDESEPYEYLIPAESDGSRPNQKTIKETMELYFRRPVKGGRDWFDYVDLDSEQNNPRVLSRLYGDGDFLRDGPAQKTPKAPTPFRVQDLI